MIFGVINLGERHVDGEFPVTPIPQMPPFDRVHGGMSGDSPVHLDRAPPDFSSDTSASFHMSVVGGVLDIGGHNEPFLGPVCLVGAVLGVPDIDAIKEGMVRDIVNETWWWGQALVGLLWVVIVDLRVLVIVVIWHGQRVAA